MNNTLTLIIAVWGALLSTALGLFEIYKWKRSGPRLRVQASGPMISMDKFDKNQYVSIRISNIGDAPTTLSLLTYRFFKQNPKWRWKKSKADERGMFNVLRNQSSPLPHRLEVGAEWTYVLELSSSVEKMAKEGYFFIEIEDSTTATSLKYARCRLLLSEAKPSTDVPKPGIYFGK